jgi:hypothetical protein
MTVSGRAPSLATAIANALALSRACRIGARGNGCRWRADAQLCAELVIRAWFGQVATSCERSLWVERPHHRKGTGVDVRGAPTSATEPFSVIGACPSISKSSAFLPSATV